ncbi:DUF4383 domain-containing protein [Streptomyces sp. TRM49041]|uniref:DUF4383 domain-containing protein n=1 Tax=Streptomyces sp. TRM49041 TaxID=2603216 RepID=UPI0011ED012F|nr:DUF4383 domain-containing protein [Streptomyces sp. TRM49041]
MAAHRLLPSWRHARRQAPRAGAASAGVLLLLFGGLGLFRPVGFFDTDGATVAGLGTNGALSLLSLCAGLLLLLGAALGGTFVSTLDLVLGTAFLVSGFVNLALLDTRLNVLAFRPSNVLAGFGLGVVLVLCGLSGRERHGPRDRHPL